jgi:hypothetical protein
MERNLFGLQSEKAKGASHPHVIDTRVDLETLGTSIPRACSSCIKLHTGRFGELFGKKL